MIQFYSLLHHGFGYQPDSWCLVKMVLRPSRLKGACSEIFGKWVIPKNWQMITFPTNVSSDYNKCKKICISNWKQFEKTMFICYLLAWRKKKEKKKVGNMASSLTENFVIFTEKIKSASVPYTGEKFGQTGGKFWLACRDIHVVTAFSSGAACCSICLNSGTGNFQWGFVCLFFFFFFLLLILIFLLIIYSYLKRLNFARKFKKKS